MTKNDSYFQFVTFKCKEGIIFVFYVQLKQLFHSSIYSFFYGDNLWRFYNCFIVLRCVESASLAKIYNAKMVNLYFCGTSIAVELIELFY